MTIENLFSWQFIQQIYNLFLWIGNQDAIRDFTKIEFFDNIC